MSGLFKRKQKTPESVPATPEQAAFGTPEQPRIVRSSRRTLALEITREGEVLVRAPQRMSRRLIDEFVARHHGWITTHLETVLRRRERLSEPTAEQMEQLKRLAKEILPQKTAQWAAIMGITPARVRITSAKTRFGSCAPDGGICYSWRLMQYPEPAIDYVVVHELAHLIHRNHSPAFYAVIERYLPDYRQRKNLLKTAEETPSPP